MKLAVALLAAVAFAQGQDPEIALQQVRDKVLAAKSASGKLTCTETIDRSYYSRSPEPLSRPSCEKLVLDRKRGQSHLKLDKTDRLRIAVTISQGHEIYSWTGAAPYAHGVEDILNTGPIGTGSFGAYLLGIFSNPAVRFHLLSDPADSLDYGFRVPVDGSHYVVAAGQKWVPAEYSGTLRVQAGSLALQRVEVETGELPAETDMCEEISSLEFRDGDRFLPTQSRSHMIMRDATETERVTVLSDCREAPAAPPAPPVSQGPPLPKNVKWELRLENPLDTEVAAAGDPISAIASGPLQSEFANGRATGRILRMIHQGEYVWIGIAWDTFYQNGVAPPFYAELDGGFLDIFDPRITVTKTRQEHSKLTGHGMANWPFGILPFIKKGNGPLIVPAGFKSTWRTVKPPQ